MINIDWSGVLELAAKYDARAAEMKNNPFGNEGRNNIAGALKQSLREALDMGRVTQSQLDNHYFLTGQGYYGSSPVGDQGLVNPQERLDPNGLNRALARNNIPNTGKSLYGSAAVFYRGSDNGNVTIDLTTGAMMTPYPNRDLKTGKLTHFLGTRSLVYYLRRGWEDPDNLDHKMNSRWKFMEYVINKFKPFIHRLSPVLLKNSGFQRM